MTQTDTLLAMILLFHCLELILLAVIADRLLKKEKS